MVEIGNHLGISDCDTVMLVSRCYQHTIMHVLTKVSLLKVVSVISTHICVVST